MAAFSSTSFQQHHPFLLDSLSFLPTNTTTNINEPPPPNYCFNNIPSSSSSVVTTKNTIDMNSSSITPNIIQNKRKYKQRLQPSNSAQSKDKREVKGGKSSKRQKKIKMNDDDENNSKEEAAAAAANYIHVRARRGQATDSHSLAERVRRERISERMKLLQSLVPGCDKVTGKALMLDEIINYVQSLQNQVEFLSMKLASVNPMVHDFGVDLESFMVRPDQQDLSELASPLASMQECSNYNFLENNNANPILFQQPQLPNVLPQPQPQPQLQGSRQALWEVDELRQKIINQSGFNHSLFSFH